MVMERDGDAAHWEPSQKFQLLLQKLVHFDFEAPFPVVSTEKEKLGPMVKEKEKVRDLPASVWQKSRHWDTSLASSSCLIEGTGIAAIFTAYI